MELGEKFEQTLKALAEKLVTPERYGSVAKVAEIAVQGTFPELDDAA